LSNKKGGVAVQRIDVAQDLLGIFPLAAPEQPAAYQEEQGALGVEDVAADASVEVFCLRDAREYGRGVLVAHLLAEYLTADFPKPFVDTLQHISRVLDVGAVEVEDEVQAVGGVADLAAGALPLQAEYRQILVADGEQDTLMHDKDDRDTPRLAITIEQEAGPQAKRTLVVDLEARADFEVCGLTRIRETHAKVLTDVATFRPGRGEQVKPGWLDAFEILAAADGHLTQAAIDKEKGVDPAFGKARLAAAHQRCAQGVGEFPQHFVLARIRKARPQRLCLIDRQDLEQTADRLAGHAGQ
jgi:hypothetical protein